VKACVDHTIMRLEQHTAAANRQADLRRQHRSSRHTRSTTHPQSRTHHTGDTAPQPDQAPVPSSSAAAAPEKYGVPIATTALASQEWGDLLCDPPLGVTHTPRTSYFTADWDDSPSGTPTAAAAVAAVEGGSAVTLPSTEWGSPVSEMYTYQAADADSDWDWDEQPKAADTVPAAAGTAAGAGVAPTAAAAVAAVKTAVGRGRDAGGVTLAPLVVPAADMGDAMGSPLAGSVFGGRGEQQTNDQGQLQGRWGREGGESL
jgi:hypothetical protein